MTFPLAHAADKSNFSRYDLAIIVSDQESSIHFSSLASEMDNAREHDPRVGQKASLLTHKTFPGGRLLHIPSGRLDRDYDDVRRIFDLGRDNAELIIDLDAKKILVSVELENIDQRVAKKYRFAIENFYLGLCQGLYQPLEARQSFEQSLISVLEVGLLGIDAEQANIVTSLEASKSVARDLCGTEPERMAPPGFALYCQTLFESSDLSFDIIEDEKELLNDFPALHAVARASFHVERHRPRVISIVYEGEGEIEKTLYLAGKGITFDTGGVDLKVNGHMAGMSRDKGGGAAVAGMMYALSLLKPKNIRVEAKIAAVRNNVDAEAYTPDEIITGHSGVRVRVGNTDAEGRMVLMDILSHFREKAASAVSPEIFSFATLTGHAAVAHGPYTALLENGPAKEVGIASIIAENGELWSDLCHQSLVRREDYDFVKPRTKADDVLSSNNAPSVSTVRGHQFPMAFLSVASGLDKHGLDSHQPIPFTHVDIAGSAVENLDWQHGKPTGAPIASFVQAYVNK